ncbi:hypothetical protein GCM10012320_16300 [Sinomonas cellulolyticus]|uniref:DUF4307 domain-containing protein n=1 Tax=Sinomonas cellulolyticus TaxID=2801916 RepID=A0ABS1JYY1_9MICC|nr:MULTISPECIES: DUF4307 domain-containing protein [Sinomonas]MBL0704455.1 DUF4307 domain-containing protein [Sinomonas cellulolyticus]GHG48771.1 hypothetical protein GCM10012320_16300 [Sinomonas sp. KCTC 49339]
MTDSPALAARYGAARPRLAKRTARLLVVAALVVAVAVAGWLTYVSNARSGVQSKDVGFSTPDPWHAEIDFQVTKDASATAVCAVHALSQDFAVVGFKEVEIGPDANGSGTATSLQRVPLRTESAAVSGVVDSCWLKAS